MVDLIQPGNAYLCTVNSHRHGWNGDICKDAEAWNCGAADHFRAGMCANGEPRCFQLYLFDERDPQFQIDGNGVSWFLDDAPDALDDQFIVLSGRKSAEPRGIAEGYSGASSEITMGIYRVKRVERESRNFNTVFTVWPYEDGWLRLEEASHPKPHHNRFGGKYMVEVEGGDIRRILETLKRRNFTFKDRADTKRFEHFSAHYAEWQEVARTRLKAVYAHHGLDVDSYGTVVARPSKASLLRTSAQVPFDEIQARIGQVRASRVEGAKAVEAADSQPGEAAKSPTVLGGAAPDTVGTLVELARRDWVARTYGASTLLELDVAAAAHSVVILRGHPGVGKSHLAMNLLDDPSGERIHSLPVPSTWHGREDLLGYVNPIHGHFQPTPFTRFITEAAKAWEKGDQRTRVVLFEEFNLSQPEHWFSDILSVSQFADETRRWIDLGATSSPGNVGGQNTPQKSAIERVLLSPALRFIGTINSDHTTRSLSPRVLDRATLITLELTAKGALSRAELTLDDATQRSISLLHRILERRGCPFSIRTANSIQLAQKALPETPVQEIVDSVLKSQVLSKLRLMAHDPSDEELLKALEGWSDDEEKASMPKCELAISTWRDLIGHGVDVIQA